MVHLARLIGRWLVAATVILVAGIILWWVVRWQTGVELFGAAHDYLYDQLGLSRAQASVLGLAAAVAGALAVTLLVTSLRLLTVGLALALTLGIVAAFAHDWIAADKCFERSTSKPLCAVWETPDGSVSIRRDDAPLPPSSWQRLGPASKDDVARLSGTPEQQAARMPKRVTFESCAAAPAFFQDGRALIYYAEGLKGIELWDKPGSHPQTNARLAPLTPEVVKQMCAWLDDHARGKKEQDELELRVKAEQEAMREADVRRQAEVEAENKRAAEEREHRLNEEARLAEMRIREYEAQVRAQRSQQEAQPAPSAQTAIAASSQAAEPAGIPSPYSRVRIR